MSRSFSLPDGTEVSCRCSHSPSLSLPHSSTPPGICLPSAPPRPGRPSSSRITSSLVLLIYLGSAGYWCIRRHVWSLPVVGCLVLSGILHLAYSLCLQRGYQVADLSVVYPIARGTGPLLSSIGAFILLRETPSTQGIFGLLAVVAGIGFISTQGDLSAFRKPRGLDGVRWARQRGR